MEADRQEGLLGWLDRPNIVVGAFLVFVLAMAAFGVLLWSDQQKQVDRIDELFDQRLKEAKAADAETVSRCFSSATQGPALRRVLLALEQEAINEQAKRDLREFRRLNALGTPTLRECHALANRLNQPIPQQGAGG